MRFRLLFLLPLLASCAKEYGPVRLDLVGATNFTSSNRTVGAGDTVTTRLYAQGTEADQPFTNLRIQVTYEPQPAPIIYPANLAAFRPQDQPSATVVYFDGPPDSLLAATRSPLVTGREFAFQFGAQARTTSGTERWEFQASTANGRGSRAYRLTVRNADSLLAYHAYTIRPRPAAGARSRAYVALLPGLLLPGFAVARQPANQKLVDLVAVVRNNSIFLESPTAPALNTTLAKWLTDNRRRTAITRVGAAESDFTAATSAAAFRLALRNGTTTDSLSSGALRAGDVLAFRTADRQYGVLRVVSSNLTPVPSLVLAVRVEK